MMNLKNYLLAGTLLLGGCKSDFKPVQSDLAALLKHEVLAYDLDPEQGGTSLGIYGYDGDQIVGGCEYVYDFIGSDYIQNGRGRNAYYTLINCVDESNNSTETEILLIEDIEGNYTGSAKYNHKDMSIEECLKRMIPHHIEQEVPPSMAM